MSKKLTEFLRGYINKESIFKNKKALQSNYTPKNVPYRGDQINQVAGILAPSLRMEKPSNVFIYGKTGTGKTLVAKHVMNDLIKVANENKISLNLVYINCKMKRVADTEYRLLAQICRELGVEVPATGLPTEEVYKMFVEYVDGRNQILILILDEIDQLVNKIGDEILYNLTRLNSELKNSQVSFIGISNDLMFIDNVDPRVKSSLSEEEVVFPPYDAVQLEKILKQRSELAFNESVICEGVIEKCAAYAAREHGDARRALELLRVAGELVERKGEEKIAVEHIDKAEEKIEKDRVLDVITTQPKQYKLALYSIINVCNNGNGNVIDKDIFTGDVYDAYKDYCKNIGMKPLTQRRLSGIIAELDLMGIINARVISKGRYGRSRAISLAIPAGSVENINNLLKEGLGL